MDAERLASRSSRSCHTVASSNQYRQYGAAPVFYASVATRYNPAWVGALEQLEDYLQTGGNCAMSESNRPIDGQIARRAEIKTVLSSCAAVRRNVPFIH